MKLLIDGDAIIWKAASPADGRCYLTVEGGVFKYKKDAIKNTAFPNEILLEYRPEPESHAIYLAKRMMSSIGDHVHKQMEYDSIEIEVFLNGDDDNFRVDIDPDYKQNRKGMRRPHHESTVADWLVRTYDCTHAYGCETDDLLGMNQTENTVIVSHDKDLTMIPGLHIHMHKDGRLEDFHVTEIEGLQTFYKQMLIGDKTDNIPGIYGIGPAKARKIVDLYEEELDMYTAVENEYISHGIPPERMVKNGQLLWIRRKDRETWTPPIGLTELDSP